MPQERGWFLHGGGVDELWSNLRGRALRFTEGVEGLEELMRTDQEANPVRPVEQGPTSEKGPA